MGQLVDPKGAWSDTFLTLHLFISVTSFFTPQKPSPGILSLVKRPGRSLLTTAGLTFIALPFCPLGLGSKSLRRCQPAHDSHDSHDTHNTHHAVFPLLPYRFKQGRLCRHSITANTLHVNRFPTRHRHVPCKSLHVTRRQARHFLNAASNPNGKCEIVWKGD